VTVQEVAEFMGVNTKTMYKHMKSFPFRVEKMGRRWLIPKRAFIEFILRTR
jgi:excisionase family DNA binding protein